MRHGAEIVIERDHRDGQVALSGADTRGAERDEERLFLLLRRRRQAAQGSEDGADGVLADGRVGQGDGAEGVRAEDGREADGGDDEVGGAAVVVVGGDEGLGDALEVVDVALDDGEVGVEGRLGDLAGEEEGLEFGG